MPYVNSLYWGVTTLGAIGYGDFYPVSLIERLYTILILLLGGLIYSLTVANLDEIVAQADITSVLFQTKMEKMKAYLSFRKCDSGLQYRVITHMLELWIHQKGCDENSLLNYVPRTLRRELVEELCIRMVDKLPILKQWKSKAMIYDAMQAETYLQGEHVFDKGEIATRIYFLTEGSVEALSEDGVTNYSTYTKGYCFGETAFLLRELHECSARATSRSNAFVLTTEALDRILDRDDDVRNDYDRKLADQTETIRKNGVVAKMKKNMSSRKMSKFLATEEPEMKQKRTYIMLPDHTAKRIWDFIHLAVVVYNCITVPFKIALYQKEFYSKPITSDVSLYIDITADSLCFLDLIFCFVFFARFDGGVLVKTRAEIAMSYLKRQFFFDFITFVPVDIVALFVMPGPISMFTIGMLRLPRMLRFIKLGAYAGSIKSALEQRMIYIKSSYRQLFKLLFLILLASHLIACIRALILHGEDMVDKNINDLYIESIYWTMYTVTTVGYGNIGVASNADKVCSSLSINQ